MNNNPVVKYLKNCYCIEDVSNIEADDFIFDTYKQQPLTVDRCRVLLKLLHELTHIIQDVSCLSSYVEDKILKVMLSFTTFIPKDSGIKFPLFKKGSPTNEEFTSGNENPMTGIMLHQLHHYHDFKEVLFKTCLFPTQSDDLYKTSKGVIKEFSISYRDLLESHGHFKSIFDLYILTTKSPYKGITHQLIVKDSLFPFTNTGKGRIGIDILKFKYQKTYFYPFYLFMQTTSFNWGDIMNYLNTYFPIGGIKGEDEYLKSYFLFTLVFEAANTIPSFDYILNATRTDTEKIYDFNPVNRYANILLYFAKFSHEELMNYQTGDLKQLIDTLSEEFGWPDYETTIKSHSLSDDTLTNVLSQTTLELHNSILRKSIKMKTESNATFTCFDIAFSDLRIPTISRTASGVKLFSDSKWISGINVKKYNSFFDAWYCNTTGLNENENRYVLFLKLVTEKIFRKTILDSDLYDGGNYCCPMRGTECPYRCELCDNIPNTAHLISMVSDNRIRCMFHDYLTSQEYCSPIDFMDKIYKNYEHPKKSNRDCHRGT